MLAHNGDDLWLALGRSNLRLLNGSLAGRLASEIPISLDGILKNGGLVKFCKIMLDDSLSAGQPSPPTAVLSTAE